MVAIFVKQTFLLNFGRFCNTDKPPRYMESLAPVVLFTYNRLNHLQETISALKRNDLAERSMLFIYSDGPKDDTDVLKVNHIRQYLHTITGFYDIQIIEREKNIGLARSIIDGVSNVMQQYGKAIVVEDDLLSAPNFLQFMNTCLNFYKEKSDIFSISGYCPPIAIPATYQHPVFLFYRINSWGWATWSDRWQKVDWNIPDFHSFIQNKELRNLFNRSGKDAVMMLWKQMHNKINSWAIRFNYAAFKQQAFTIYPTQSKINNLGADGSGSHVSRTTKYATILDSSNTEIQLVENPELNNEIIREFQKFYTPSIFRQTINFAKLQWDLLKQ